MVSPRWISPFGISLARLLMHPLLGGGAANLDGYPSLIRYSDPSLVRANVRRALEAGFRSLKLHEIELQAIRAAHVYRHYVSIQSTGGLEHAR
jgi:hypothetical protein